MRGKTALVTGSTVGLGLAISSELAAQGCNVIMTGFGDPNDIEARRAAIEKDCSVRVSYISADLRYPAEIARLVEEGYNTFGTIDILVNNAVWRRTPTGESGRAPPTPPLSERYIENLPPAQWDLELAINLSAPFHLIRLTMGGMRRSNWGRIINISSTYGIGAVPGAAGYVTTKTAILGLTRVVAMETSGTNITCNALCPSAVLGETTTRLINDIVVAQGVSYEAATEIYLAGRRRERFVTTVPAMIVFLCAETGKDMTGAVIPMDLGTTAGLMGSN